MDHRAHLDLATADGQDRYVPSETKDIVSAGHEGVYEWATENLVREGTRFLDLGCGTGYGSALVTAVGGAFDGVDGSPSAIEYARANYSGTNVRFFVADLMEPLPAALAPQSYDVVFSSEVLEHVVDPFAFVHAMASFVRDDGTCFVGTPNRLFSKEHMPSGGLLASSHLMEFTPPALSALLLVAFAEVTLYFRMLSEEAIQAIGLPTDRPPLIRGALAFVREVAPGGLTWYRKDRSRRSRAREWSPKDIPWLSAEDAQLEMRRCVGLAAVCRGPRR